jgi:ribosomal protein S12 methylthiotransferase accessory factor
MDAASGARSTFAVIDDLTGITNGVRSIPVDPGGPSVFAVTARMSDTTGYLGLRGDPYNSWAGLTEEEAWESAIGETIERYCLAVVRPERMTVGAWSSHPESTGAVHPCEVALFDEHTQARSPRAPFTEETVVGWLPGRSLVSGRVRLVPACLVHIPYARVHEREELIAPAISTGSAAGRSVESAVLGGLYECVERDAVSITWLNRLPVPRLVLDEEESARLFAERFERPNLEYRLFVIELDLGTPTVISVIRDTNFDPPLHCIGGAARADVRDAARKALVESVQGWHWARHQRIRSGPMTTPSDFSELDSFPSRVQLYAAADMRPALAFLFDSPATVRLSEFRRDRRTAPEIAGQLVARIHRAGSDVIVVHTTTPEIAELGWCTLKVFCPGLQQLEGDHNFRLLGGPRWRDVPVTCGLRSAPLSIDDVNPYPHPYP